MCGIAGVHEHRGRKAVDPSVALSMLDAIAHRGPDDEGLHLTERIALGARRLSIIDPEGGHQPIANEDGTVVAAFNGEIYNYRALRERLLRSGHVLRTNVDTEVLVHLYEELGEGLVDELDGMFAFSIWDERRQKLLLVRDRLGIKPLYVAHDGERLVFGSEIKSLLRHPDVNARPDLDGLAAFLLLKYAPAPRTMFAGIEALPPGHLLVSDERGVRTRQWWDLSFKRAAEHRDERDATDELRAHLRAAVRSHLVSDVPFGAFLSGGIDCSTVVALMSQELDHPVRTFVAGFEGPGEDLSELPYARMVAERYETEHHEVLVSGRDLVERAHDVVWHLDQPIADIACLANLLVAELAAQRREDGAHRRGRRRALRRLRALRGRALRADLRARAGSAAPLGATWSGRSDGHSRPRIALYALCQPDEQRRLATWFPLMRPDAREALAVGELATAVAQAPPATLFADALARSDGPDRSAGCSTSTRSCGCPTTSSRAATR